jgi:signal transduction histidine kinase/CheY-like chemotaxis protein/HPt (histidine-containing phosphotransfer) domain-containing protein
LLFLPSAGRQRSAAGLIFQLASPHNTLVISKRMPPALAGLGASILIFSIAAVSAFFLYTRSLANHKQDFREDLLHTAGAAASLIDVNLHNKFVSPAQETTAEYLSAIAVLDRIKNSNKGMKFIYTCVLLQDTIYFVLDPTPAGDADGDGVDDKSHIMQTYPDAGDACRRALATGKPMADEEPYTDAWGTFLSAYAPFFDTKGNLVGVVGVDKELTEYTLEARGMREAGYIGLGIGFVLSVLVGFGVFLGARALQIANVQRQKALEAAEKAAKVKAEFLAVMSHEIRTPLSGVIGMLDALLRSKLEGKQGDLARKARSGAETMLALLNDILDFSKIEAGAITLESAPFDAVAVAEEALDVFRDKAGEKGLKLLVRPQAGCDFHVLGDSARLRQVLFNLVGNAVKFTKTGEVRVVVQWTERPGAAEPGLEFRVEDTGIGIPKDKQGQLFQSFSQADVSTTREYGGTGLGLAICRHLVELMGGRIGLASAHGEGSVFFFTLPLPAEAARTRQDSSAGKAPAAGPGKYRGLRLLLAEDDPVNREVALLLVGDMGCSADVAVNGSEAVALAAANDYAVVMMDCRMPEMDGFQATAAIRALGGPRSRVPIVAMTANSLEGDKEACLRAGMDDYLTKPMRLETLLAALDRRLAGASKIGRSAPPVSPSEDSAAGDWETDQVRPRDYSRAVDQGVLEELSQLAGEGNPAFLGKLIKLFLEAAPADVAGMEKAVSRRDAHGLGSMAHDLKGSGANMGAFRLSDLCQSLEDAGEAEAWEHAEDLLSGVKAELAKVEAELGPLASRK